MRWEIEDEGNRHEANDEATEESWRTRLSLELPSLGGVDAQIRLQGDQVILSINVNNSDTRVLMQTESDSLHRQLQQAWNQHGAGAFEWHEAHVLEHDPDLHDFEHERLLQDALAEVCRRTGATALR